MTRQHAHWTIAARPALVGLAVVSAIIGAFAVVRAAENVWAADAERNLAAALALANGTFGSVEDYLYSPLAAALTMPALAVPTDVAVFAWLVLELSVLVVGTAVATRGREQAIGLLHAAGRDGRTDHEHEELEHQPCEHGNVRRDGQGGHR